MTDFMLLFLIYDIATARQTLGKIATAENKGLSPGILADNKQNSESFWRHEQDILSDVVRQMEKKCTGKDNYPVLWDYCNSQLFAHTQVAGVSKRLHHHCASGVDISIKQSTLPPL